MGSHTIVCYLCISISVEVYYLNCYLCISISVEVYYLNKVSSKQQNRDKN